MLFDAIGGDLGSHLRAVQNLRQIDPPGLPVVGRVVRVENVDPPDHLVDRSKAQLRHQFAGLFGNEGQIVHDVFGLTRKTFAKLWILGSNSHGAGI